MSLYSVIKLGWLYDGAVYSVLIMSRSLRIPSLVIITDGCSGIRLNSYSSSLNTYWSVVSSTSNTGSTPLVEILVEDGSDVGNSCISVESRGGTVVLFPVFNTFNSGTISLVEILVEDGSDVGNSCENVKSGWGTVVLFPVSNTFNSLTISLVEILVEDGSDVGNNCCVSPGN